MSSRNPQPRFARARTAFVGLLAIILVGLYGFHHRAELAQIFDELRPVIPIGARSEAAVHGAGFESNCPQIP